MQAVPVTALFNGDADWALGQFNVHNIELALAVIRAAETEKAPVILAVGPSTVKYLGDIAPLIAAVHKIIERASVPVALHLDHARDLDLVRHALDLGFSSVMFDGSALPLEENLRLTTQVVEMGHKQGASVEGEIGIVPASQADGNSADNFTDPGMAAMFAEKTGIDLIAVSVGSVHGMQSQDSSVDCDLIRSLSSSLSIPQVLHGASGVVDECIPDAIASGIRKININTMLQVHFKNTVAQAVTQNPGIGMLDAWSRGMDAVSNCVRGRIQCFNSSNQAH